MQAIGSKGLRRSADLIGVSVGTLRNLKSGGGALDETVSKIEAWAEREGLLNGATVGGSSDTPEDYRREQMKEELETAEQAARLAGGKGTARDREVQKAVLKVYMKLWERRGWDVTPLVTLIGKVDLGTL